MHPSHSFKQLVELYQNSGVNAIEFGIPSKNPLLDGSLIQNLHQIMRTSGVNFEKSLEILKSCQDLIKIPVFGMTYSDVVLETGEERFLSECKDAGLAGVIVPDMNVKQVKGIVSVKFVDIYNEEELIQSIGYDVIYLRISRALTGQKSLVDEERIRDTVKRIRKITRSLIVGGFGINSENDIRSMMSLGLDGLAISTSILRAIEELSLEDVSSRIRNFSDIINESYKI